MSSLLEDNTIQPFVSIGNVTLWSGNHIGHHSTIHDHYSVSYRRIRCVVMRSNLSLASRARYATISPSVHGVVGAGALPLGDADADGAHIGTKRRPVPSTELSGRYEEIVKAAGIPEKARDPPATRRILRMFDPITEHLQRPVR